MNGFGEGMTDMVGVISWREEERGRFIWSTH